MLCLVALTKPIAILESLIHTFISLSSDRSYIFRKIMSILQLRKLDSDTEKCAIKRVVLVAIRQS
jgi:hypothetical protein